MRVCCCGDGWKWLIDLEKESRFIVSKWEFDLRVPSYRIITEAFGELDA